MEKHNKIYVAGHRGLVGSALTRKLKALGYENLVTRTHGELDLTDQQAAKVFFQNESPDYVFLAAARVGGILANRDYPADFIYQNLMIESNVIEASYKFGVKKLLFLGSSCIYPKFAKQPMKEEYLLTGELESTNEPYSVAKIAGIKLCQSFNRQYGTNFITVMPTNLYGIEDNFDLETSHVIAGMIRKFHEAKESGSPSVILWGDGTPRREFLFADDLADACVFLMNNYNETEPINVGVGEDLTVKELAELIQDIVDYKGEIEWDTSKPNGTPRKLLDISRVTNLGWKPSHAIREGINITYHWYSESLKERVGN